jgi:hypothetical protein
MTKAERVAAAWNKKRANAGRRILTRQCRGWLKPRSDGSGFDVIPDRVQVLLRIFTEAADKGMGADLIARHLNERHIPTFGRSSGWHKSYVLKILTDRAVLGEFQPHTKMDGKRRALHQMIPNYYPAVIDEALFYRAQRARHGRRRRSSRRKGTRISNLFSGILHCATCRGPLHLINKGAKGGRVLICDRARRAAGCQVRIAWPYRDFELSCLTFIGEANLPGVVGELTQQGATVAEVAELEPWSAESNRKRDQAAAEEGALKGSTADISNIIARLQAEESDEISQIRRAVAARLKRIIDSILVWPGGIVRSAKAVNALREMYPDRPKSDIDDAFGWPSKDKRAFFVSFKDKTFRFVAPQRDDPTKFRATGATSEPLITDLDVRDYLLARYGIENPTRAEYERALELMRQEPASISRYGVHIVRQVRIQKAEDLRRRRLRRAPVRKA